MGTTEEARDKEDSGMLRYINYGTIGGVGMMVEAGLTAVHHIKYSINGGSSRMEM